jgi:hypothetical protein
VATAPASGILSAAEHYDLRLEDMNWCKERNAKTDTAGDELSFDKMEILIDLFEKKAGAKTKSVRSSPTSTGESCFHASFDAV